MGSERLVRATTLEVGARDATASKNWSFINGQSDKQRSYWKNVKCVIQFMSSMLINVNVSNKLLCLPWVWHKSN